MTFFINDQIFLDDPYSNLVQVIRDKGGGTIVDSKDQADWIVSDRYFDAKVPIVVPVYVHHCVIKGVKLPWRGYLSENLLAGVVALVVDDPQTARQIQDNGGLLSSIDDPCLTHVITQQKMELSCSVWMVKPQWLHDSLLCRRRMPEYVYFVEQGKDIVMDECSDLFRNFVFLVKQEKLLGDALHCLVENSIVLQGGRITRDVDDASVTHVVSTTIEQLGMMEQRTIVSPYWIIDCIRVGTIMNPLSRVLNYPRKGISIHDASKLKVSISNYNGYAREYIKFMLDAVGASYTPHLTQENTHLITCSLTGEKAQRATDWGLLVVNHIWIEECLQKWELLAPLPHHLVFRAALQLIVGQTCVLYDKKREMVYDDDDIFNSEDELVGEVDEKGCDDEDENIVNENVGVEEVDEDEKNVNEKVGVEEIDEDENTVNEKVGVEEVDEDENIVNEKFGVEEIDEDENIVNENVGVEEINVQPTEANNDKSNEIEQIKHEHDRIKAQNEIEPLGPDHEIEAELIERIEPEQEVITESDHEPEDEVIIEQEKKSKPKSKSKQKQKSNHPETIEIHDLQINEIEIVVPNKSPVLEQIQSKPKRSKRATRMIAEEDEENIEPIEVVDVEKKAAKNADTKKTRKRKGNQQTTKPSKSPKTVAEKILGLPLMTSKNVDHQFFTPKPRRHLVDESVVILASPVTMASPPSPIAKQTQLKRKKNTTTKIVFTGFRPTTDEIKDIASLGGTIVSNIADSDVVVATKVTRTEKFLVATALGIPIVERKWLEESAFTRTFQSTGEFILCDKSAEESLGFKLKETLSKAKIGPLMNGMIVTQTISVTPDATTTERIVTSAGAKYVTISQAKKLKDKESLIVISCEQDKSTWSSLTRLGLKIHSIEIILTGVLKYEINREQFLLK